ncbi:MAG: hypothetical protein KH020_18205 [Clostridiales bacterium]|nr:hypothetical protein [Clostridiales bacterium]
MSLRYNGTPGYIDANTLVGLPVQTKTVTPSIRVGKSSERKNDYLEV